VDDLFFYPTGPRPLISIRETTTVLQKKQKVKATEGILQFPPQARTSSKAEPSHHSHAGSGSTELVLADLRLNDTMPRLQDHQPNQTPSKQQSKGAKPKQQEEVLEAIEMDFS
jgi:hypothetical protein